MAAPYAAWPSPISTADVARSGLHLGFPTLLGDEVWWTEDRPGESGRTTIMHRAADGTRTEVLPAPWSARSRVHEYGGRAYVVVPGRGVVFADQADQRLYLAAPGAEPRPLTPEPERPAGLRFADLTVRDERIWCVQERHHHDEGKVVRSIVSIPLDAASTIAANTATSNTASNTASSASSGDSSDGSEAPSDATSDGVAVPREHVTGSDFYAFPTISPDGEHLAYVCWNHPRMPWTGTELRITKISDGSTWTIKGGLSESVLAPQWKDDRHLYLISDWSGWWNLYQIGIFGTSAQALYPAEEEFAGPLWQLGGAPYLVLGDGRLAVLHGRADARLAVLDPDAGTLSDLDAPYDGWDHCLAGDGDRLVGVAYGATVPRSVVRVDTRTGRVEALRREIEELPDIAYLPTPRPVEIDGRFGRRVHAYLYPPANPQAVELPAPPPYVLFVHGGPTGHATGALDLVKAFFTSRGIGVLDVNYGGSTGYGRAYRERLRGQWGVVDVEDVIAAAEWLGAQGLADPAHIAIRGGSAGGWTVMAACCASDAFAGGVSCYGVSALAPLAASTHDFESRYIEWLVGPEDTLLYGSREPLGRVAGISCPMLLMQGLDDPVVPPRQSEAFVEALSERGVPCTYLTFEGEAHGFRRAETRTAALAAELAFYQQIFIA